MADMLQLFEDFQDFGNIERGSLTHDRLSPPPAARSRRRAYALAGAIIGLALFASGTPSPLYGIYRELWGFSPLVLTLVYATYAFGVLAALLLAGRVSDDVGRRPVLLAALGALMGTTVLFMVRRLGRRGSSSRAASRAWRPAPRSAPRAPRCSICTRAATRRASG